MDKKSTGVISYITIIGWILAFLVGDREGAKFHLNQSLVLNLANLFLTIVAKLLGGLPFVPFIVWVLDVVVFIFWIIGFVAAIKDEEKEVPVLGGIKILQ